MLCIASKLCYRLRDENVEPVQALGLMTVDVVVCLRQDRGSSQGGRVSQNGRAFLVQLLSRMARCVTS